MLFRPNATVTLEMNSHGETELDTMYNSSQNHRKLPWWWKTNLHQPLLRMPCPQGTHIPGHSSLSSPIVLAQIQQPCIFP